MPDLKVVKELKVGAHISGGVEVQVGSEHFVLPPDAAVQFGEALLKASGRDFQVFAGPRPAFLIGGR
jgi:hypothetical protein